MLPFAPAPPLALPHHSPTTFRSPSIAILLLLLILLRHPSPLLARNVRNENECISDSDKYRSDSVASRDSLAHLCATFVQPLNDASPVSLCMYTPFIHRELYIFRSLLLFFFLRREERFFFSKNYAYLTIDRGNYYRFNLIMIEFISIFFFSSKTNSLRYSYSFLANYEFAETFRVAKSFSPFFFKSLESSLRKYLP